MDVGFWLSRRKGDIPHDNIQSLHLKRKGHLSSSQGKNT
jgi:hypothetical protein